MMSNKRELIKVDFVRKKVTDRSYFDPMMQTIRKTQKLVPEKIKLVAMEANTAGYATHKAILVIPVSEEPSDGYVVNYLEKKCCYQDMQDVILTLQNTVDTLKK